ncbi:MAG: 50S ribosomal protein L9 [Fimbriimonadaceae bacterium]|nr:50S ribosomal protein L9 [Fimbriimonadaceae bacterium]
MKVILNQTVPKVGKEGQVVNVADGFARNYLFPRRLAILADKNQVKALEQRHARMAAKISDQKAAAESSKESLNGQTVRIPAKVGADGGKLFGAITAGDVAEAVKAQLGHEIDRRRVALVEPIKRLGIWSVLLDLHRDVDAHILVDVYNPDAPVEVVPAAGPIEDASAE